MTNHPTRSWRRRQRGAYALGIVVVMATTAVVGAGAFGLHRWSTGNTIKQLVPEWQVKRPGALDDLDLSPSGPGESAPPPRCEYKVADSFEGQMPPATVDACATVVEQALCSETCSNTTSGFEMHPLLDANGEAYSYQGRLRFLGCVPSTDGSCPIHIQGVGGDHAMTDPCGAAKPGCYFGLSQADEGVSSAIKDFVYACQTASGVGALTLADAKDRACIESMVDAGSGADGTPLACHSWGTAFCAQNGFLDAEYYGGLCPVGAEHCAHNSGDIVPCAIYECWLDEIHTVETIPGKVKGVLGAIGDLFGDWDQHPDWANREPRLYEPPDRGRCKGEGEPPSWDDLLGDVGVVVDAGSRHDFWEYLNDRRQRAEGSESGGLVGTDRVEATECVPNG